MMAIKINWTLKEPLSAELAGQLSLETDRRYVIGRSALADILLPEPAVSREHAVISVFADRIEIEDSNSGNGTFVNGRRISKSVWRPGDRVEVGTYLLELFADETGSLQGVDATVADEFPPAPVRQRLVPYNALADSGRIAAEVDYLAVGGGLGSFAWVDHLRIFGVKLDAIKVIGIDPIPYGKYKRLCANSQIPDHERLRSNSPSTPDNIWGFPGYASRETLRDVLRGRLGGLRYILQVFGEPALAPSYTPRASDVFRSLDAEAARIGWDKIWTAGRAVMIRKTDDDRYLVAYRQPAGQADGKDRNRYMIARYLHLATGYPASRYLDDLQQFKREHPRSNRVVNAYEEHGSVYEELEAKGGTVLVRGRGIVASRILQRLSEIRKTNDSIAVLHVVRSRLRKGRRYDLATRYAAHDVEYQPFNWPKACWSGTLRRRLEQTPPEERYKLLGQWGGTTTADRPDWDAIIANGKREGWYRPFFGAVRQMTLNGDKIVTELESSLEFKETVRLEADYIIDCTGLIADLEANPLIKDLIGTYGLHRNRASGSGAEQRLSGLATTNSFEIDLLRNGAGRAYSSGVLTVNGPYAAVDSFLGLQYSALRSMGSLYDNKAPGLTRFGAMRSFRQWLRWCRGAPP